ncbi:hypothetical protein [Kutzneria sp. CA-103260]|uniref:hypothetical protein n=1 Tax=Kutzneria sp. CA-103260 TaxID=2802641 RepID=UPI001BA53B28|nr:hypothetical protein [Kutzneria sp. CA-103260]QUQ65630.1 hypothetical protein JJ691_33540 [Kutzneria sp. CA-103260]
MTGTLSKPCCCPQPCGQQSCELRALVRPRFFCGQLLTDQDLSELTAWVLDRRRLGRYRDGWGVVCGLDVDIDTSATGSVVVQPGYAVSSCGEDIVLPTATSFDVTSCCPELSTPCGTPSGQPPTACVVDLGVSYREVGEDPVLALGRSACGETGECEDSRTLESFQLVCKEVVDGAEPPTPGWTQWESAYRDAVDIVTQAIAEGLPGQATAAALASWLRDRLRERPLRHFGFVADWLGQCDGPHPPRFEELVFWIAQDRILSVLDGGCPPGCAGDAVPLARIWLSAVPDATGVPRWVVKTIDPVSPFRHEFGPTAWPAPFAQLNLGRVVWHRLEQARLDLRGLGVPVTGVQEWSPSSVDDVRAMIGDPPLVDGDSSVWLRYVMTPSDTHLPGWRVVGFAPPKGGDTKSADQASTTQAAEPSSAPTTEPAGQSATPTSEPTTSDNAPTSPAPTSPAPTSPAAIVGRRPATVRVRPAPKPVARRVVTSS